MTLRKIFLKLALFVGLILSGLVGQAQAAPFVQDFEGLTNTNLSTSTPQSSFTFTSSGVAFMATVRRRMIWNSLVDFVADGLGSSDSRYAAWR